MPYPLPPFRDAAQQQMLESLALLGSHRAQAVLGFLNGMDNFLRRMTPPDPAAIFRCKPIRFLLGFFHHVLDDEILLRSRPGTPRHFIARNIFHDPFLLVHLIGRGFHHVQLIINPGATFYVESQVAIHGGTPNK